MLGLVSVTLPYGLQNLGLMYTSAGNAALLFAVFPAAVAVIAALVLGEKTSPRKILGICLAIIGVIVITWRNFSGMNTKYLIGDALVLGSVLVWAGYTVLARKMSSAYHPMIITVGSFGSGLILLFPLTLVEFAWKGIPQFSLPLILGILYLGILASAAGNFLWNQALSKIEANVVGVMTNLQPVFGVVFSVLVGEAFYPEHLIGGGIAIIGVIICTWGN